jgi:hypothetical protein
MPNINVKALLREVGLLAVAIGYGVANKHLADPEQTDCQCQVHQEAAKIGAAAATPPAKSRESRGTRTPPQSPKSKKATSQAKGE